MRKGAVKGEKGDRVAAVSWNLRKTLVKCGSYRIYPDFLGLVLLLNISIFVLCYFYSNTYC